MKILNSTRDPLAVFIQFNNNGHPFSTGFNPVKSNSEFSFFNTYKTSIFINLFSYNFDKKIVISYQDKKYYIEDTSGLKVEELDSDDNDEPYIRIY